MNFSRPCYQFRTEENKVNKDVFFTVFRVDINGQGKLACQNGSGLSDKIFFL